MGYTLEKISQWVRLVGILIFFLVALFCGPHIAIATSTAPDVMGQLNAGSGAAGYGTTAPDPRIVVANGVKVFLSLLGTIFLVLVVYAGFLMFTAAGNDEQIGKAKGIIINSVIGLIIIMSAYSITSFVTKRILNETISPTSSN